MTSATPLPDHLVERYRDWRSGGYAERAELLSQLASGQAPHTMIISCCDSRVHTTEMFGAAQGEVFLHRNIASLVPAYDPQSDNSGTPAAIEYGVTALKVSHVVVVGHSGCGGVNGTLDICAAGGRAGDPDQSFVSRWLDILKPSYPKVADITDSEAQKTAFEQTAVKVSLSNLMSYPFVAQAVEAGELTIHGLWNDIGKGVLKSLDAVSDEFVDL